MVNYLGFALLTV